MQREREKNKYHQVPIEIPLDNSLLKPATIPACLGRGWTTNCFCLPLLFFYLSRSIVGLSETSHPLSSYTKMHQARRQKGDLIQVAQDSPFRPHHTLSLKIKRRLALVFSPLVTAAITDFLLLQGRKKGFLFSRRGWLQKL